MKLYLLVSRQEYCIEMFHRANKQSLFYFHAFEEQEAIFSLMDEGFEISLSKMYDDIQFEETQTDDPEAIQ